VTADDYGSAWVYRLKWAYLLLVVATLMSPVFYVMYISFNANGFGARNYDFTLEWYRLIFVDSQLLAALRWTMLLALATTVIAVPMALLAAKHYKATQHKLLPVFLLLAPLFVAPDILGSALLVFFKNVNFSLVALGDRLGTSVFDGWFRLATSSTANCCCINSSSCAPPPSGRVSARPSTDIIWLARARILAAA
jgi:spermidine/putrescine transport system permease protein